MDGQYNEKNATGAERDVFKTIRPIEWRPTLTSYINNLYNIIHSLNNCYGSESKKAHDTYMTY